MVILNYLMVLIQYNFYHKKHETLAPNPFSIINIHRSSNRLVFKIQTAEKNKLFNSIEKREKTKNRENMQNYETAEVILVKYKLVENQQKS